MVIKQAKEVLRIEAEGILNLIDKVDERFKRAAQMIYSTKGRVIVTGMGKSGLVGRKIVATLNSTGTPALFLHPSEGMHGDLGMVTSNDIVLAISNSGETEEVNLLISTIKKIGVNLIAFTGEMKSTLARQSDIALDIGVQREACPLGLAPTASTTAALAMGDALAVALLNRRGFKEKDFHLLHPGGALGMRLMIKVKDVMLRGKDVPTILESELVREAIAKINERNLGFTLVVSEKDVLRGIVTDGDLRRHIQHTDNILEKPVCEIMTSRPKTIEEDKLAHQALELMEKHEITVLVIVGKRGKVKGIVHLHDLLGKGEFKFTPYGEEKGIGL
jgi:arabinose-5-phosphate isomerase